MVVLKLYCWFRWWHYFVHDMALPSKYNESNNTNVTEVTDTGSESSIWLMFSQSYLPQYYLRWLIILNKWWTKRSMVNQCWNHQRSEVFWNTSHNFQVKTAKYLQNLIKVSHTRVWGVVRPYTIWKLGPYAKKSHVVTSTPQNAWPALYVGPANIHTE